jgi:hypothetical protein
LLPSLNSAIARGLQNSPFLDDKGRYVFTYNFLKLFSLSDGNDFHGLQFYGPAI